MENTERMQEFIRKAGILVEALPYIQKISGKTIVVKYGGNAMVNDELKQSVMEDITLLKYIGAQPIVVHGGGPDITAALKTYNVESRFINGLRYTDADTMNVAQMVLVGKTNKAIVSTINAKGGKAIGLCGIDGGIIQCRKKTTVVDGVEQELGFVGDVVSVDTHVLNLIADDQFIPVIAPIGTDENGQSYNINADTAASAIAAALGAEKLMFLTDIEGVFDRDGHVIYEMSRSDADKMIENGTISGGMIPKVQGCLNAIESGVSHVHIIDGRVPHCLLLEIFTDTGIGTMITR